MNINQVGAGVKVYAVAMAGALACTIFSLPAAADSPLQFKGGIGVHPVSSGVAVSPTQGTAAVVESVSRNIVRGVQPAGQIWVIDKLEATVNSNGSINVNGQGLILAGGNNAGRAPAATSVIATLICDPTGVTQSSTSTAGVPLSPNGDFMINDTLSPAPTFPCASPMLLIRNAANLGWFAVGIFRSN